MRGARVFIGSDRSEAGVGAVTKIEEPWMCWISDYRWRIGVAFAEETEAKCPDILDAGFDRVCELMFNAEIHAAHFRVPQVGGNRPHTPEGAAARGSKSCQYRCRGSVGVRREKSGSLRRQWIRSDNVPGNCHRQQGRAVKVQRVQHHVIES